jgi:SAM-dependent methyltransferase
VRAEGYLRRWVECAGCGSATNVHPAGVMERLEAITAGYYEVDFKDSSVREKFDWVMSLPPERSDNAQRVERILAFLNSWRGAERVVRTLDVGAGTGVFLARLLERARAQGWVCEAVGVEPDPHAAAHLRELGRFAVVQRPFDPGTLDGTFALITLNKVLEHVPEPLPLLRGAAGALNPEIGLLYMEVPDKETAFQRPPGDNVLGALHRHLYTPAGVAIALERAGLHTLRIDRVYEPSGKISIAAFAAHASARRRLAARPI